MLFKCIIYFFFDKEAYQLVTMLVILVQALLLHPLPQMFFCFFFCLPSNLLYFASMFPGCRQPQKTDAHLLYSCGNRDNPGRSRLTVPARTSPSIYQHSGFHINLKFPQQHTHKIFCWFHPNTERFNSTSAPSYPYVTPRGGGAKVPASNPGVYTMGAWRRLPEAKPSAAERVESLCQLLWNAEADWWGPGDSFRAWWGSRQRCEPEQTPQGTPSPSVHTFGGHVTELPDAQTWEKWKKKESVLRSWCNVLGEPIKYIIFIFFAQ